MPTPARKLRTHPYVTNAEFSEVMGIAKDGPPDFPVVSVTALEADEYCRRTGGRLPASEELDGQVCLLWEWTSTKNGEFRVVRGGSFHLNAWFLRAAYRNDFDPGERYDSIGFRCIKEAALPASDRFRAPRQSYLLGRRSR